MSDCRSHRLIVDVALVGQPVVSADIPKLLKSLADKQAASLLSAMLERDPRKRPSAVFALSHAYFRAPCELQLSRASLNLSEKRGLLYHAISLQREEKELKLTVTRSNLVESVCAKLRKQKPNIFQPWSCVFESESGYGQGVTDEMFSLFFQEVCKPDAKMFIEGSSNGFVLPAPSCTNFRAFEAVGRLLLKCLIDERAVRVRFAPSLFKFLIDIEPTLEDLRLFSSSLYRHGAEFVLTHVGDISKIDGIEYTPVCVSRYLKSNLCVQPEGKAIKPTEATRQQWVRGFCRNELVAVRETQLKAIRTGFRSLDDKVTHTHTCFSSLNHSRDCVDRSTDHAKADVF